MVGWLCPITEKHWFPVLESVRPLGQPLLRAALPPGKPLRRLKQGAKALVRRDLRRVLLAPGLEGPETAGLLGRYGLTSLDPLPLCRVKGGDFALFLLKNIPIWERRVVLRGEVAGPEAWPLADALCPQVGQLFLDFGKGEEELARYLRSVYGAVALHLGQGLPPQVSVEFDPMPPLDIPALRLWGRPELCGLTLRPPEELPPDLPALPFLTLLWETGRIKPEELAVAPLADYP